jgi:hypothetical protein
MNFLKTNGMNTLVNNYDAIERLIYEESLQIEAIDFHPELDVMLIVLNTKAVLRQKLSSYTRLANADKAALMQYELICSGTGVHWPLLDEDLSLKGFLRDELRNVVRSGKDLAAA